MKRSFSIILAILLLTPELAQGQSADPSAYKNSAKINMLGMAFNNISLIYERSLSEHWAILAGSSYRWGGGVPKAFALGNVAISSESQGIRSYSFTPELRYYFNFCECGGAPSGLYTGLYGRFTKYYGDLTFNVWTGEEYADAATAGGIREFGLGLQLGYQFVFKGRFLVDIMFAGPRIGTNRLKFSIESDYTEQVVPIIEEEINEKLEWLGMDPITIEPSPELDTNFSFIYFRYALSFGIRF